VTTVHVYPVGDLIEHDTETDECICGPVIEPVPDEDGSMGWLITHNSLDGRERHETPGGPAPKQNSEGAS
jgi:hypothetical protein